MCRWVVVNRVDESKYILLAELIHPCAAYLPPSALTTQPFVSNTDLERCSPSISEHHFMAEYNLCLEHRVMRFLDGSQHPLHPHFRLFCDPF